MCCRSGFSVPCGTCKSSSIFARTCLAEIVLDNNRRVDCSIVNWRRCPAMGAFSHVVFEDVILKFPKAVADILATNLDGHTVTSSRVFADD